MNIRAFAVIAFAVAAAPAVAQNIVANGSFEDPQYSGSLRDDGSGLYWYARPAAPFFNAWTVPSGESIVLVTRPGHWESADGNQYVEVESGFAGFFTQTLATVPGQQYRLEFAYAANPAVGLTSDDDAVRVLWDGSQVTVTDGASTDGAALFWSQHSFVVTATGSSTVLRFEDAGIGVFFNGGYLDNISVVAVPAPGASVIAVAGFGALLRRRR